MSFKTALVALALVGFAAPPAFASEIYTAKLATPLTSKLDGVRANNVRWNCLGDTCLGRGSERVKVLGCQQLSSKTGSQILSYSTPSRTLSAEELERCNTTDEAKKSTTETASN